MIGLDTNVIVRYIMRDDEAQAARADALIESLSADEPGFVPTVAALELAWVLSSSYELDRAQVVEAFEGLLRTKEIVVEGAETLWKAVRLYAATKADFADCLLERSAAAAGCARTMTFDKGAAKSCGMQLVR